MTFAKNRTYGGPEFAGTEVNRCSGNLKGLTGVPAQDFHNIIIGTTCPAGIAGRQQHHRDNMSRRHSWPATATQRTTTRWSWYHKMLTKVVDVVEADGLHKKV